MVDWVGNTGVLGYALISEIDLSFFIQSNVLKQSVSLDCIVDIWLRLFVQVDNFCVAASLEVEYAVVIPAVLIITDQQTLRICRQSGLTCTRQTEDCLLYTSPSPRD